MMRLILIAIGLSLAIPSPAFAHIIPGTTASFSAGIAHPFSGLDHITVMLAVGLWAGLQGGRALWVWPGTFVGVMLIGGVLGMGHVTLPFVEPGILASVVALGLMVAMAVKLPIVVGAAIIGAFALLHGHAHGSELAQTVNSLEYMIGFAVATAGPHALGVVVALTLQRVALRSAVRLAGVACIAVGIGLFGGVL